MVGTNSTQQSSYKYTKNLSFKENQIYDFNISTE